MKVVGRLRTNDAAAWPNRRLAAAVVMFATVAAGCETAPAPAPTPAPNGSSVATAAPSCWAIKASYPDSASGRYYLNTKTLGVPQQFYCDMTTDGGGWVLVGRGREGWTFSDNGQSPAALATSITANTPAALSAVDINGLLDGQRVSSLADGIRLRRASAADGSAFQEVRMKLSTSRWTWRFSRGYPIQSLSVDGTAVPTPATTRDTFGDSEATKLGVAGNGFDDARRVRTYNERAGFADQRGFAMGTANGSGSAWYNPSGFPVPFTQVFIRPKITSSSFAPLSARTAARQVSLELKNTSQPAPWGVYGVDMTNEVGSTDPQKASVFALQEVGSRMFVGGAFTNVRNGPTGALLNQRFLAAFDLNGTWIPSFTPVLNGRVWDMAKAPDGKLLIAGDFTSVNGVANTAGLAKLDPVTGAVDTSFKFSATLNSARGLVRAIDVQGGVIYAGGRFNSVKAAHWNPITTSNAVSVNATTAVPGLWRPKTNGVVFDIDASSQGDRVYLAGWFTAINNVDGRFYATRLSDGALLSNFVWGVNATSTPYAQYVEEIGNRVFVGHREHSIVAFDRTTAARVKGHVMRTGGDFQAIVTKDSKVWAACHCGDYDFVDAVGYRDPATFTRRDRINQVGQFDANGNNMDEWLPLANSGTGDGPWDLAFDSRECLWWGGDLDRRTWTGDVTADWVGEFMRFCPAFDRSVPTTPTTVSLVTVTGGVKVSWSASTDASNDVRYVVLRDGRAVAVLGASTRTFTDTRTVSGATYQYAVIAVDSTGNRSASTTLKTITA